MLSFNSELVAGDVWRWFCLLLINFVIDYVVRKAVVHVHVSTDNMALPVALSILNICTGQHILCKILSGRKLGLLLTM